MISKERKFTIGRERKDDIVLADSSVSRQHAQLTIMESGRLFLIDCQSRNGTALLQNGKWQPIHQELISPTDTLQFGDVKITAKELLEAIQLKFPNINTNSAQSFSPQQEHKKSWDPGDRLVRCECGEIKVKGKLCRACGK